MAKTLKIVNNMILFLFLFLIIKNAEAGNFQGKPLSEKAKAKLRECLNSNCELNLVDVYHCIMSKCDSKQPNEDE
ncbi:unnamed protein product [Lathyrus oleraceus]